jgi:hypothetical protein
MQMYFANGGGPCYVISVDEYDAGGIDAAKLLAGILPAEQADEITLIVIPEAMAVADNFRKGIYDTMLGQCAELQDRFAILDTEVTGGTVADDADHFRDDNVGANNLKYGAAYYPSYDSGLPYSYVDGDVDIVATDANLPPNVLNFNGTTLATIKTGSNATGGSITIVNGGLTTGATLTISGLTPVINLFALDDADPDVIAANLAAYINSTFPELTATNVAATNLVTLTTSALGSAGNHTITPNVTAASDVTTTPLAGGSEADNLLYNRIGTALGLVPLTLYPSSMMAGVYATVDNDRGVWKAPANVGVNMVDSLTVTVSDDDQGLMNVDATSGKSINVIRKFNGRGILVWGARTLDGNSNEWRYVPVRRLFIMAEESCKKASEFVVFEPNDKNTWVTVKGMITNFLTDLWRQGALAGDKPDQAFFVKVGLNETMTAQDILEGKLIIQVGMAAVRPSEFIILQFMHKLQEA